MSSVLPPLDTLKPARYPLAGARALTAVKPRPPSLGEILPAAAAIRKGLGVFFGRPPRRGSLLEQIAPATGRAYAFSSAGIHFPAPTFVRAYFGAMFYAYKLFFWST